MPRVDWHRLHLSEPITTARGWNLIYDWANLAAGWGQSPFKSCDCYTVEERRVDGDSAIISTTVKLFNIL